MNERARFEDTIVTRTTCPYCGVGCGVAASVESDGRLTIAGDASHPANGGRLCIKGASLAETLTLEGRLLTPEIAGRTATWTQALEVIATRFDETIAEYGPDSVAFYVSGQILTEDYYVANKLMKGFIGAANIDTNSRLCMAASVAGHKRAFGADIVPGVYADLEQADLIVLVGSNLAWCHPVLHQRIMAARAGRNGRPFIVNIDPRRTATSESADMQLSIAPGSDVALFSGLLAWLDDSGHRDEAYVSACTEGAQPALDAARQWTLNAVAEETRLPAADIEQFFKLFAQHERVVTVYSQGVNQSAAGADKVNAILNCHLLTGRIGKPGCGPFSVTGQPNAMGGREVGGLANQLAAHMEIENPEHRAIVREFWNAPRIADKAGLKAVEMFRAVADGRIRALWIMGTNPVDSLPDADAVRRALAQCPFVVVSDVMRDTDTTGYAHVLLPARVWSEKDGTVTNSERRISRQRAFRAAPGLAKPDWWAICRVAQKMGFDEAFDFQSPAAIFREHAALSGYKNAGKRDFDISACATIDKREYESLEPFQWPAPAGARRNNVQRFFANGGFFTPSHRARFVALDYRRPVARPDDQHPFVLNTGRIRDQWHTMTRTGVSPRLAQHCSEAFVEINPEDAARLGVEPAGLVELFNARGSAIVRALVTKRQRPGSLFCPIHWTDQFASQARINALIAPACDPVSGQPESKAGVVGARPAAAAWYAFLLSSEKPDVARADYWALARTRGGYRAELAGMQTPDDWEGFARTALRAQSALAYTVYDKARQSCRIVFVDGARIVGALFAAPHPVEVSRSWLCDRFIDPEAGPLALLAGRPANDRPDPGPRVCVCFDVGANDIARALCSGAPATVEGVGDATNAGTGCGSCRPEIAALIERQRADEPAATS